MLSFAQVIEDDGLAQYQQGFPFVAGIYTDFEEFKNNQPKIQAEFERRGSELWVFDDSLADFVLVNPNLVWGYSQAGNVYISQEEAFWRLINIGALSQYTAIAITTFQTVDNFGFPITRQSKSMRQLFFDFNTGKTYLLNQENLQAFIDQDPLLAERYKKLRKKDKQLIMALKAYNELHPIYFPLP